MTIEQRIEQTYRELVTREHAAGHLAGIARLQNQTAIDGLYDSLNDLHIARLEALECEHCGSPTCPDDFENACSGKRYAMVERAQGEAL